MSATELSMYNISILIIVAYTIFGWLVPLGVNIGYGRVKGSILKVQFDPKISWFLFEVANLIWAIYFIFVQGDSLSLGYILFIIHYINRDIIYPLRMKTTNKVPLDLIFAATSFTTANGYLQGIANQKYQQVHGGNLVLRIVGVVVFFIGMAINIKSDSILQAAKQRIKPIKEKEEE